MRKSRSRTSGFSIPAPATRPQLVLIGKKGPAFTNSCPECDGFQTVVTRRSGQPVTVRCACQLAVSA
ncbi:hypothetical protein IOD14_44050 (plasmid) [Streptomyces sp. A2-16]|uniref:hypothetical protein n=1 Tax=Streptomyces sp. A2-16 TaxID=2781734 RepID=UPI001BAFB8E7|nr:hypothetical protein [Streptomyces sp. A2-16]QUC63820.1 hypothetical protein IOD14_44050 [Streptomyces sp. A2-16]